MTKVDLKKYEALGWQFKKKSVIEFHNGDREDQLCAKSPRLKNFFVVTGSRHIFPVWEEVSEDKLIKRETFEWAEQEYLKLSTIVEYQVKLGLKEGKKIIEIDIEADYSKLLKKYYE